LVLLDAPYPISPPVTAVVHPRRCRLPRPWPWYGEAAPVKLGRCGCSFQFGRASAPTIRHEVQTMRGPKEGTGVASSKASTFSRASWWHTAQARSGASSRLRERMHAAFARATQLEWVLWDSAYRLENWAI